MDKTGFLEEAPGVKSSTRLNVTAAQFSVLIFTGYMIWSKAGSPMEIGGFFTSAMAAIGAVKYLGTKNEIAPELPK